MRVVLALALVVSLWPVAAIAALVATGGDRTVESGGTSRPTEAEPVLPEQPSESSAGSGNPNTLREIERELRESRKDRQQLAAEKKLARIAEDTHDLNEELVQVEITEGVPLPEYAERGAELERRLTRWFDNEVGNINRRGRVIAEAVRGQLEALQALADSPEQATLNAYNEAVQAVNRAARQAG